MVENIQQNTYFNPFLMDNERVCCLTKNQQEDQAENFFIPKIDITKFINNSKGKALTNIDLVGLNWDENVKKNIVSSFKQGLKINNITVDDLNQMIKNLGIISTQWNEENIKNPKYSPEIKKLQSLINEKLNNKSLKDIKSGYRIPIDGQLGKTTINAIVALQSLLPINNGKPIFLEVKPLRQITPTGCYRTSEAMLFNYLHKKDSKEDYYTELDLRQRVKDEDRNKEWFFIDIKEENESGRVSVSKKSSLEIIKKINQELDKNYPVIAGTTYFKQIEELYNEGITDHFILITGRGYDEDGLYFLFNDPADGGKDYKLRLDPYTGKLSANVRDRIYDITGMTVYCPDPKTFEKYEKIGKPVFKLGDQGSGVKKLQEKLTDLNYDTKGIDGRYFKNTKIAVEKFQQDNNLPVTGMVDSYTLKELNKIYSEKFADKIILQKGSSGEEVSTLQQILKQLGFYSYNITGTFGDKTKEAVEKYQAANNLNITGTVSVRMLETLKNIEN